MESAPHPPPWDLLSEQNLAPVLRMLAAIGAGSGDAMCRRRHLVAGVADLIDAARWAWVQGATVATEAGCSITPVGEGGAADPEADGGHAWLREAVAHEARRSRSSAGARERFCSGRVEDFGGTGPSRPVLIFLHRLDDETVGGIGYARGRDAPDFSDREMRLALAILGGVDWNIGPCPHATRLSPRQRVVLEHLLLGHGRKTIARSLRISVNTVSGYVKDIYRTYAVQSHAGLMRRFRESEDGRNRTSG